jgi:hypothetical protein
MIIIRLLHQSSKVKKITDLKIFNKIYNQICELNDISNYFPVFEKNQ